jgi:hypothetical protein
LRIMYGLAAFLGMLGRAFETRKSRERREEQERRVGIWRMMCREHPLSLACYEYFGKFGELPPLSFSQLLHQHEVEFGAMEASTKPNQDPPPAYTDYLNTIRRRMQKIAQTRDDMWTLYGLQQTHGLHGTRESAVKWLIKDTQAQNTFAAWVQLYRGMDEYRDQAAGVIGRMRITEEQAHALINTDSLLLQKYGRRRLGIADAA